MRTLNDGTPIPILRATIWYADGSKANCQTPADWVTLPSDGVVLVQVLYAKTYKGKYLQEVLRGCDYYWFHAGAYDAGPVRSMRAEVAEANIKRGAWLEDPDFQRLYNEACEGVKAES